MIFLLALASSSESAAVAAAVVAASAASSSLHFPLSCAPFFVPCLVSYFPCFHPDCHTVSLSDSVVLKRCAS